MLALVLIMSLYYGLLGYVATRWRPRNQLVFALAWAPALWLLIEWLRGWLFTGFSWLSLGYSQTDTPLRGFAPLIGVYGISWLLLLGAGALAAVASARTWVARGAWVLAAASPFGIGAWLQPQPWTEVSGAPVGVAIVQGAIPQDEKWLASNRDTTLKIYRDLTRQALGTPLIVWPEAAAPDLVNNLGSYFGALYDEAQKRGSAIVMGALRADDAERNFYNSILALDNGVKWYDKHHLVPFAEFFPVPKFVRNWLRLLSLPYSDFTRGASDQAPLPAAGLLLAASVCYEDAYGSTQIRALGTATAMVNVTNDAWFGRATARYQHLQITRMRAMEARRYMIRAANDGVSAIIDPWGRIVQRAPEFKPTVLRGEITPRRGLPPYARTGNGLVLLLALLSLAVSVWRWRSVNF
jgi:apolipoprotein N-acyltransferase